MHIVSLCDSNGLLFINKTCAFLVIGHYGIVEFTVKQIGLRLGLFLFNLCIRASLATCRLLENIS